MSNLTGETNGYKNWSYFTQMMSQFTHEFHKWSLRNIKVKFYKALESLIYEEISFPEKSEQTILVFQLLSRGLVP